MIIVEKTYFSVEPGVVPPLETTLKAMHGISPRNCPSYRSSCASTPVREKNSRVDQLAVVQGTLQNGATATLVAGIAMLVARMQAQVDHPGFVLTVSSGIGSLVYDLTRGIGNPRSHSTNLEPTRPPMNQERSLRMQPTSIRPLLASQHASATHCILPTPSP